MTPKGGDKRKPTTGGRHVAARHTPPRGAAGRDGAPSRGGSRGAGAAGGRTSAPGAAKSRTSARRNPAEARRGRGASDGSESQWRKTSVGELGGDQVEGRRAVLELLASGRRHVHNIWISDGLDPSHQLDEIEDTAQRMRVPVETVPRTRLEAEARTDAPQGVLAHAHSIEALSLEDLCQRTPDGAQPFLLVAAGVTDPHNLGALLRSAECAGVTGVVLPRHRAVHLSPTVTKVAAGAIEHLDFAVVGGIPAALEQLAKLDVWSIGLASETDRSLFELPLGDGPVALVLGSEGKGLAPLVRKRCDALVAIPQHGSLSSLNVSVAGAVAFFEVARQRSVAAG